LIDGVVRRQVFSAQRGSVESQESPALEDSIHDGLGEIVVMKDGTPALRMLVRGEDHRALLDVTLVDNVEQDVGRVIAVGQVADLIDEEHVRLEVVGKRLAQPPLLGRRREVLDELGAVHEQRLEAVLERAIGDGDAEMGLAATRLALKDHRVPLGHEVGRQQGADRGEPQGRLVGEVELLDRTQEWELCRAGAAHEAGAPTVCDLLGEEREEELLVGPLLALGALREVAPHAPRVREMKPLEKGVEGGGHGQTPAPSVRTGPGARMW